jgi:hypothetical protein
MSYNKTKSSIKQRIRELLLRHAVEHMVRGPKRFLTLPHLNFFVEDFLLEHYPGSEGVCYESDKAVWKKGIKKAPKGIDYVNEDVFKAKPVGEFDFVWIDLCNAYTDETISDIVVFLKQTCFAKYGVFALTLMHQRGHGDNDLIIGRHYPYYKTKGIMEHLVQFINRDVKEVRLEQYKCHDTHVNAASMNLFIFKLK